MDNFVLEIYKSEVLSQGEFALLAIEDLEKALGNSDTMLVWYSIQTFLVAVGNISKLLWSKSKTSVKLRASLNVPNDSPLCQRTFRNHFEHFDERLEKWASSSTRRNFVDKNIMPAGSISGIVPEDYLRNFDPINKVLTFRGEVYDLKPVISAIQDLMQPVIRWRKGFEDRLQSLL